MNPREVFVIVPAYNEAPVIEGTVMPLWKAGYSIVVVDDCSSDRTWEILAHMPVYSLRHPINLGQGAALQTGMAFALAHGAKYLVHFDADGQHPSDQVPRLLEPILEKRADVVLGSRFLQASDTANVPWMKRFLLRSGRLINYLFTGLLLSDAHNGFRALSRKAAEQMQLRENGFAHATEIIEVIHNCNLRVMEVPTTIRYTDYSVRKGQPVSNALNIVLALLLRRVFK